MDNRQSPRHEANQPVKVTTLGVAGPAFPARLTNFSSRGIGLALPQPLPVGSAVKVEWGTTLLLGEVMYCDPQGGEHLAGLSLVDALYDTDSITRG